MRISDQHHIFIDSSPINMKVFAVLCLVAGALGSLEPAGYQPPSSRYLPANRQSNQYNSQASSFGGSSFGGSSFGASSPQKSLNNQYLAPQNYQQDSFQGSSRTYLAPAIKQASNQYKPYSSAASSSSSSFSSPSYQSAPASSHTSYSAPSTTYSSQGNVHSSPVNSYSAPSASYASPAQGYNGMAAGRPSSQYLSPNAKQGYSTGRDYQEESEPANYNFEYQVNDEFGNDFGHKENRQNEKSVGVYSVLLPDGRKQIVEYEADEEGFRPRISYEEIGGGFKNAKSHSQEGPY